MKMLSLKVLLLLAVYYFVYHRVLLQALKDFIQSSKLTIKSTYINYCFFQIHFKVSSPDLFP